MDAFLNRLAGSSQVPSNAKALVVLQGEQAVFPLDEFEYCGSEDATTCVIVVLLGSQFGYVAHLDDSVVMYPDFLVPAMGKCTNGYTSAVDAYLVGAYDDDGRNCALKHVLTALNRHNKWVNFKLRCVGAQNRNSSGGPRTTALALHLASKVPLPCAFAYRGPELARRHASRSFLRGLSSVLDGQGRLTLPGFTIPELSDGAITLYEHLIAQAESDPQAFLVNTSTSPEHESERFIPDIRASCEFILERCAGTEVPPLVFTMQSNGVWL
ncbi:hypothetical protein BASA81_010114 [Batrachochytrium salamandrivorans]|nr:hypothetical protein BASA81_010114 [Batrachochytrium salamandrivorans]